MLRAHPYAGARIPMRTLHREIHSKIHDVPRPNGDICKRTYRHLVAKCKSGELDPKHDTPVQKLQFFIDEWAEDCPATAEVLKWQQQLIRKFYKRRGGGEMKEQRWTLTADMTYDDQSTRDEVRDLLLTNGVYESQICTDSYKGLTVEIPGVNMALFLRYEEILTRFHTTSSGFNLSEAD